MAKEPTEDRRRNRRRMEKWSVLARRCLRSRLPKSRLGKAGGIAAVVGLTVGLIKLFTFVTGVPDLPSLLSEPEGNTMPCSAPNTAVTSGQASPGIVNGSVTNTIVNAPGNATVHVYNAPVYVYGAESRTIAEVVKNVSEDEWTTDEQAKARIKESRDSGNIGEWRSLLEERRSHLKIQQAEYERRAVATSRGLAAIAMIDGKLDEAKRYNDEVLQLAPNDIDAINRAGNIYFIRGNPDDAEKQHQRALALARQTGRSTDLAPTLGRLGIVFEFRGQVRQAEDCYEEALGVFTKLNQPHNIAWMCRCLGNTFNTRGETLAAIIAQRLSLEFAEKIEAKPERWGAMAGAHGNLCNMLRIKGELEEAEAHCIEALRFETKLACREGISRATAALGSVYFKQGRLEKAETMHRDALAIDREIPRPEGIGYNLKCLGQIRFKYGDLPGAQERLEEALKVNTKADNATETAVVMHDLANIHFEQGNMELAEEWYRRALEKNREINRPKGEVVSLKGIGETHLQRGDFAEARKHWEEAVRICKRINWSPLAKRIQSWLDDPTVFPVDTRNRSPDPTESQESP